jgi:aspartyl-tRNA(Asn)/glutamyl-tRNA(Gln) amidotransferase subunit A
VNTHLSLEQANKADKLIAIGKAGKLTGIPLAHKDVFVTRGWKSTAASKILAGYQSPFDAAVVSNLGIPDESNPHAAGMVCLGKTNMDEFAMGSSNENSAYGPVLNPWNIEHVAGGSSGGSAAAVAAGLAPIATGTDTGGSIRQPAAFCGLTGIKPTYGRVSRYGMIAYASSLDQAGPMGKSAEDCALLLSVMSSHDPRDSTSLADSGEDYGRFLNQAWQENNSNSAKPLEGLRIGLPKEFFAEGLASDVAKSVNEAAKALENLGAKLVEVSLPKTKLSIPVYYVLAPAEASSNLSRFDGVRYGLRASDYKDLGDMYQKSRTEGFGAEVKRRILIGTYVLCHGYYDAYYLQAQKIRRIIAADFQAAFKECDLILGPVAPDVAWRLGEKSKDPVQMYLEDIYTLSTNLAGLPAMSVPCGFNTNKLPIGMQLIGNYFSEARLLQVAHQYQQASDWHLRQASGVA